MIISINEDQKKKKPMTNELVLKDTSLAPSPHEIAVYQTMAATAESSKMYKHIGDQAGIMAIMLSARELAIPPMLALNKGLQIIQGNVEISARLMSALIRRAGHSIQIKSESPEECVLVGQRADSKDTMTVSFSLEEARKAGLVKDGGGWKKWTGDMLYARALSRLARRLFADVIGGCYVEGEIKGEFQPVEQIIQESDAELIGLMSEGLEEGDQDLFKVYIEFVRDKLCKTVVEIKSHFDSNQELFLEKFKSWKAKNHA